MVEEIRVVPSYSRARPKAGTEPRTQSRAELWANFWVVYSLFTHLNHCLLDVHPMLHVIAKMLKQWNTPFLIANRHLFSSDRQIALVSSAGIPLRQRSPHIDIVHIYKARGIENRHSAPRWHWSQNLGYWISMLKLNAPAEIHWRRSNMNKRDPILMKSVEVLKDCRSLKAADEMNCPMPHSVEKVPVRSEKRCSNQVDNARLFKI